jgi:hypothetical protein
VSVVELAVGWAVVSMISGPLIGYHLRSLSPEVGLRIGPDGSLDDAVVAPRRCMSQ